MLVRDVMTRGCVHCSKDAKITDVAKVMASQDIGIIPVYESDKLVGAVTDRDVVVRGVALGRDIREATAGDLMSDDIYYCFDDQTVEEAALSMSQKQVRRLPIVNRDKRLVGMLSLGDLASEGAPVKAASALVGVSVDFQLR